nr:T9SS type A sorting domain-containing protein [Bacteroidota bacterium]
MKKIILFVFLYGLNLAHSQGLNHVWKLGYGGWFDKGVMTFDTNAYQLNIEHRPQGFAGTEATICDSVGNLLMSSNGVWIANATGDTMDNGAGLNPGQNVGTWPNGLLNTYANIILPYPGDSNKYILFHHTDSFDGFSYLTLNLFYSIIDITLDNGLGSVISKNNIALTDTINWGIAACRHANGRDWWIVTQQHNSDTIIEILLTPFGMQSISKQKMNVPDAWYNGTQITFSPDGKKMAYTLDNNITSKNGTLVFFDFDRCTGLFSNPHSILILMGDYLWGMSFSPNSNLIYTCTPSILFQVNTTTLYVDTLAIYDGFYDLPNAYTTFGFMYLAANGHIYMTSAGSALRIHEISAPDSADTLCNFQQHNIFLNFWNFRAVPNHPNYYLGCDTSLGCPCYAYSSIIENGQHDFRFRVYPNPVVNNYANIGYILPQNKKGILKLYDVNGKLLYTQGLPPWSNEQGIKLPLLCNGMYNLVIQSDNFIASKKIIVAHDK